ncbi:MAG: hypothetical protein SVK08_11600 [Halobacteriota archaeon]|nr:hypothetical protein [Halobacteriota archaeon]
MKKIIIALAIVLMFVGIVSAKSLYDDTYDVRVVRCDGSKQYFTDCKIIQYDVSWVVFRTKSGKQVSYPVNGCTTIELVEADNFTSGITSSSSMGD